MNIAFIGCGFVFDIYMRTLRAHPELVVAGVYDIDPERMARVKDYYGFRAYHSYADLLADPSIDAVVNLTPIAAHYSVNKQALLAGKHVYSEKPLTKYINQSRELFDIANVQGVRLYAAPCNIFADSVRTIFRAVANGKIGKPLIIYAELDDNPIHLMHFDKVSSPTGAPWPLREEVLEGCTHEHLGYHLVWICGLLGPVISGTAFSTELISGKVPEMPGFSDTPDYSVACLHFGGGATARITCSVVAPRDHKMRVIGSEGELTTEGYRHYRAPVYLERYRKWGLDARKLRTIRNLRLLRRIFGIGGRKITLVKNWKSHAVQQCQAPNPSLRLRVVEWLRRREVYAQDKLLGIAEMARDIANAQKPYLSQDFIIHINELTLLVQAAGPGGAAFRPTTRFDDLGPIPGTITG